MPEPVNLAFAFGLPPERALAYFRAKGYQIAFDWREVWAQANTTAFTVAKAMREDILRDIRMALERALEDGLTLEEFIRDLRPLLQARGWWGKGVIAQPDGTATLVELGSVRRLQTIFRTNVQTAYAAGRWRGLIAARVTHPYLQYVAVLDDSTRPSHRALHGRTFRIDDPIWRYVAPPNGFNCRCRLRPVSWREVERGDVALSESGADLRVEQRVDRASGLRYEQAVYRAPGMTHAFAPDPGWSYNPGVDPLAPFRSRRP